MIEKGCDASILIDGNNTEKDAPSNGSVKGFEVVDEAKDILEKYVMELFLVLILLLLRLEYLFSWYASLVRLINLARTQLLLSIMVWDS